MTAHELYPYTGSFLDVDGGQLHYLDEGKSNSSQPVMLAVHETQPGRFTGVS